MKTRMLLVLAAVLLVLLLGEAAPVSAAGYDIHFVGLCDGLHLEVPSADVAKFAIDGWHTGCVTGGVFGVAKPNGLGKYGVDKGTEYVTSPWSVMYVINKNKTWINYWLVGGQMKVFLSGTWEFGLPAPGPTTATTVPNPNAAAPTPEEKRVSAIQAVKEIRWVGSCAGMHLVIPSVGLGLPKTVDGFMRGCETDPIFGVKTTINGKIGTYVMTVYDAGVTPYQLLIFPNKTYQVLGLSGNHVIRTVSGKWQPGLPTAGEGASPFR